MIRECLIAGGGGERGGWERGGEGGSNADMTRGYTAHDHVWPTLADLMNVIAFITFALSAEELNAPK